MDADILTVPEAVAFLRIGRAKLARLTAAKQIPSFTIGDRRLYRRSSLESWIADLEAGAA